MPHGKHKKAVFSIVRNEPGIARSEIARRTGLSKSTTERLIRSLVAEGILVETLKADRRRQGRGGIPLSIHTAGPCVIGVDMHADKVIFAGLDLAGETLIETVVDVHTDMTSDEILARMIDGIGDVVERLQKSGRTIKAIGFGDIGVVDSQKRLSLFSSQLPNWHDVPTAERLTERFGLPVYVQDTSRLNCLAEARYGVAKNVTGFVFIELGIGIGLGLYHDGELYSGEQGCGCEIGHVVVDPVGPICSCGGRGCLEAVAGARAIVAQAIEALRGGGQSILTQMVNGRPETLTIEQVFAAAERHDRLATTLVDGAVTKLGLAIGNICNLFNPIMVVLGGQMATSGVLWEPIKSVIRRTAMPWIAEHMSIEFSTLGEDTGILGAAELAIEHLFDGGE